MADSRSRYSVDIVLNLQTGEVLRGQKEIDAAFARIGKGAEKAADDGAKATEKAGREKVRSTGSAEREIQRIHQQTARQAAQQERLMERSNKALNDARVRQGKQAANELIRTLEQERRAFASAGSGGGLGFGGTALASALGFTGAGLIAQGVAAVRDGVGAWLDYASAIEQARIAFTVMIGSAGAADQHIRDLTEFAKKTPFELRGLIESSQTLQALGFEAREVIPVLTDVGNAVSAAGGGAERLERVIKALADIRNKGKVETQELRQLAENGIPAWRILEEQFGKSRAELVKMVEAGEISSKVFLDAFSKFSQQNFGGLMAAQSRTFLGALSNIKDGLLQTANTAFGPLFEQITQITVKFADEINGARSVVDASGRALGDAGVLIARYVVDGIVEELNSFDFTSELYKALSKGSSLDDIGYRAGAEIRRGLRRGLGEMLFGPGGGVTLPTKPPTTNAATTQAANAATSAASATTNSTAPAENLKKVEKARDLINDLATKLQFFGDKSAVAETRQKLLALGISAVNDALGRQAIAYAQALDAAERAADAEVRRQKDQQEARQRTESLAADITSRVASLTDEFAEMAAATRGGVTELEKFNQWVLRNNRNLGELKGTVDNARIAIHRIDIDRVLLAVEKMADEGEWAWREFQLGADDTAKAVNNLLRELRQTEGVKFSDRFITEVQAAVAAFRDGSLSIDEFNQKIAIAANWVQTPIDTAEGWAAFLEKFGSRLQSVVAISSGTAIRKEGEEYASLIESLNGELGQLNDITERQITLNKLQKLGITDLNDARADEALRIADTIDAMRQAKEAQEAIDDMRADLEDFFDEALTSGIEDGWRGLMDFIYSEFKRTLTRMFAEWISSSLIKSITGVSATPAQQSGGGGILSTLFGALTGGGRAAVPGGTPTFNPNSGSGLNLNSVDDFLRTVNGPNLTPPTPASASPSRFSGIFQNVFGGGNGNAATSGGLSFGNLLRSASPMLPLLGLSIGAGLGQGSLPGTLLGGAGGFLAPIFPLAGIPLLISGALLGRNARRRQDETIRGQINNDTGGAIWALIDQARAGRLGLRDARAQFDQIMARYDQGVAQIRDGKTRRIALATREHYTALWPTLERIAGENDAHSARSQSFKETYSVPTSEFAGMASGLSGGASSPFSMPAIPPPASSISMPSFTAPVPAFSAPTFAPPSIPASGASTGQPGQINGTFYMDAQGMVDMMISVPGLGDFVGRTAVQAVGKDARNNPSRLPAIFAQAKRQQRGD